MHPRKRAPLYAWLCVLWLSACSGGTSQEGPPPRGPEESDAQAVEGGAKQFTLAAGRHHSLALRADGTVWAWGSNTYGQLGQGSTRSRNTPARVWGLSNVNSVAAGELHSLALKDGTVWAWGNNERGQLGLGSTTGRTVPTQVPGLAGLAGVTALAAGHGHALALRADRGVLAWGDNHEGDLGLGHSAYRLTPSQALW